MPIAAISRPGRRAGVSLLELMIAVTMLGSGLLALAGPSAALARGMREATLDRRAAALAGGLAERHARCELADAGDTVDAPLHARWTAADADGARRLDVVVADATGARPPRRFAASALCAERLP